MTQDAYLFEEMFEAITHSRACTACNGDLRKCNGHCNGMLSFGTALRAPVERERLRAERMKREENEILAKADAIRARLR